MARSSLPVLVGAAQLVQREADPERALDPVTMMERVARAAAVEAGAGDRLLAQVDTIAVPGPLGWRVQNAPRLLAERLGAEPEREIVSALGGEGPVVLVNHVAREIAAGRVRVALIVGSHAVKTLMRARAHKLDLGWPKGGAGHPTLLGEALPGSSERENAYGLLMPIFVYPLYENALRFKRGLDLDTHTRRLGELMSRMSEVAARNPYAWFPTARSPEELTTPTASNRMVCFPYTKYLNSIMETDQAAAVWMLSAEAARSFGIPDERRIWWHGGANGAEEPWFPTERPDFSSCPTLADTVAAALAEAGAGLDEIDAIDFYSCFPSAVEMACEMLGLDEADPRGFTLTGGLPYAGGPGNSYTLHAIAALYEHLREGRGSRGLVTGNGWYFTKHSAVVCASEPPTREARSFEPLPRAESPQLVDEAEGDAIVETYTVVHDREGAPERGIVVGRLLDGGRFLADTPADRALLESFEKHEAVGRAGRVSRRDGRNRFNPS
jgi:acetyl-CoA C-acetyltransferase